MDDEDREAKNFLKYQGTVVRKSGRKYWIQVFDDLKIKCQMTDKMKAGKVYLYPGDVVDIVIDDLKNCRGIVVWKRDSRKKFKENEEKII